MAAHAIAEVDGPAAVSKFTKSRHDGLKLKQSITIARNGSHTRAARIIMIGRARDQEPVAIML